MIALGWFVLGLAALIGGAELMVRGGSRLAGQLGVTPLVIGLTVVAVGTSAPELAVGVVAALRGSGSLAVGNIAGTNTVNLLFILGLSALLTPLALQMRTLRFDLPAMIAAAVADGDGMGRRPDRSRGRRPGRRCHRLHRSHRSLDRRESRAARAEFEKEYGTPPDDHPTRQVVSSLASLLVGIAAVVIGTSSPELVTTVVATLRNNRDIAVGNLLGSSVYNILLILGVTCLVPPSGIHIDPDLIRVDIPVMTAATLVCVPVLWSGRRVTRLEGALFVGAYIAYLTYLVLART
jgi:cation:H+ antiporter